MDLTNLLETASRAAHLAHCTLCRHAHPCPGPSSQDVAVTTAVLVRVSTVLAVDLRHNLQRARTALLDAADGATVTPDASDVDPVALLRTYHDVATDVPVELAITTKALLAALAATQ